VKPDTWGDTSKVNNQKLKKVEKLKKKRDRIEKTTYTPNLIPFIKYSLAIMFIAGVGYMMYHFLSNIDSINNLFEDLGFPSSIKFIIWFPLIMIVMMSLFKMFTRPYRGCL